MCDKVNIFSANKYLDLIAAEQTSYFLRQTLYLRTHKLINCRSKPFVIPLWFLPEIKTFKRPRICLQRPSTIFFPYSPIIETTSYYLLVSDFVPHSYRVSITIDEHSIPTAPFPFSSYRNDSKYRPYSSFSAITIFGPGCLSQYLTIRGPFSSHFVPSYRRRFHY